MHQKSPTFVMTICIEGHLLFIFIRSEVKASKVLDFMDSLYCVGTLYTVRYS